LSENTTLAGLDEAEKALLESLKSFFGAAREGRVNNNRQNIIWK
jgi:hypothetical protein